MPTELSTEIVQSQLSSKQQLLVNDETMEEINHLVKDPDYGPEFLECYMDHLNVLQDSPKHNHTQYLQAVKFYSLVEAGNSLINAYIKVFPDRFEARKARGGGKDTMRGEASRYNSTRLVNEIRRIGAVPVQLIHRHLLHEAILVQATLMREGKSDFVRQKASETLIRELKPTEDHTINVKVNDGATSVIDELRKVTEELAAVEHKRVLGGVPLQDIARSKIIEGRSEEIEDGDFN
jgi:hypothetical protein